MQLLDHLGSILKVPCENGCQSNLPHTMQQDRSNEQGVGRAIAPQSIDEACYAWQRMGLLLSVRIQQ